MTFAARDAHAKTIKPRIYRISGAFSLSGSEQESKPGSGKAQDERREDVACGKTELSILEQRHRLETERRKGGEAVSRNREHMAEIGRKGGQARGNRNRNSEE